MKVMITGGCGQCGRALVHLPFEKVFYDRNYCPDFLPGQRLIQGSLSDRAALAEVAKDVQAIIHLAAASKPDCPWEEVLESNIVGVQNVLEVARQVGVERVVFGSSNRVVNMFELRHAPMIYELGHGILIDETVPVQPANYYGVSKAFGEHLGRYYAENGGPRFYALRIGSMVIENHPYAYAERGVSRGKWERNSPQYVEQLNRLKALWLSHRDFNQIVRLCLEYQGANFDVFNAISNNARRWLDISHAQETLGYRPQDNAEEWNGRIDKDGHVTG
jgi:NAD+ dependent glucose-6-phosphate dehydrogenase